MNGLKRIQKEYKSLIRNPLKNIKIYPNPDNIYEWYFLIIGTEEPYLNGYYIGIIKLPEEYPLKAPSILMKTPNGRFKIDTRLCFSMSDYHQETWNPNWNIRTILIGFYSFMLEESDTLGSINTSNIQRIQMAKDSYEYNKNNFEFFNDLLNEEIEKTNKEIEENICRFCYESNGILESVCNCKGTNQYIHKECLNQWQLKTILNQSTHPKYQVNSDLICSVCNSNFKIKGKSREELMKELTGDEIIKQLELGYVFISSKSSSESNLKVLDEYEDIELPENIKHWIYGVFLIINKNENGIIAINTNRNIQKSCLTKIYYENYKKYIEQNQLNDIIDINDIYIGGPCENDIIVGLLYIKKLEYMNVNHENIKIIYHNDNNYVIIGEYKFIYTIYHTNPENNIKLRLYMGYAGWSITQLYGEFAKTNWGISNIDMNMVFENDNYDLIDQSKCLFVKNNIYSGYN